MRAYVAAATCLVAIGCATNDVVVVHLSYQLIDHPSENRVELLYRNDRKDAVCISAGEWPNVAGKLNQMGDRVFLVVGDERFPIEDSNTGYCVGNKGNTCVQRVGPGEEISGYIAYKEFNLLPQLRYSAKKLEFSPQGYICD